jgi:hypothetical protein
MKNKNLILLLGAAAAYWYFFMYKKKAPLLISQPGMPDVPPVSSNPTPETTTIRTMEYAIDKVYNTPDQDHVVIPSDASTYQTTYGTIMGIDRRKVPLTC